MEGYSKRVKPEDVNPSIEKPIAFIFYIYGIFPTRKPRLEKHLFWEAEDVNQDKHIGVKEFDLLLKNLEFRETLQLFGHSAERRSP